MASGPTLAMQARVILTRHHTHPENCSITEKVYLMTLYL